MFNCKICLVRLSKNNLNRHMNSIHGKVIKTQHRCLQCNQSFFKIVFLRSHLEAAHGITPMVEKLKFYSKSNFDKWLQSINREQNCQYVLQNRSIKLNTYALSYYFCRRSGTPSNASRNMRLGKKQGSCKIGYSCTSQIVLRELFNTGEFIVTFFKTHYGHSEQLEHLRLPKSVRQEIANKLVSGVTVDRILDSFRETVGGNLKRTNLIRRRDIHNIASSLKIHERNEEVSDGLITDFESSGQLDTNEVEVVAIKNRIKSLLNDVLEAILYNHNKDNLEQILEHINIVAALNENVTKRKENEEEHTNMVTVETANEEGLAEISTIFAAEFEDSRHMETKEVDEVAIKNEIMSRINEILATIHDNYNKDSLQQMLEHINIVADLHENVIKRTDEERKEQHTNVIVVETENEEGFVENVDGLATDFIDSRHMETKEVEEVAIKNEIKSRINEILETISDNHNKESLKQMLKHLKIIATLNKNLTNEIDKENEEEHTKAVENAKCEKAKPIARDRTGTILVFPLAEKKQRASFPNVLKYPKIKRLNPIPTTVEPAVDKVVDSLRETVVDDLKRADPIRRNDTRNVAADLKTNERSEEHSYGLATDFETPHQVEKEAEAALKNVIRSRINEIMENISDNHNIDSLKRILKHVNIVATFKKRAIKRRNKENEMEHTNRIADDTAKCEKIGPVATDRTGTILVFPLADNKQRTSIQNVSNYPKIRKLKPIPTDVGLALSSVGCDDHNYALPCAFDNSTLVEYNYY